MAQTIDPGLGKAWRYGQAIVATKPKSGSTGLCLYWRYGQPMVIYTAAAANVGWISGLSPLFFGGA